MVLFKMVFVAVLGSLFTTGTLAHPRALSEPSRPCHPSPCGPNSECTIVGVNHPVCKCLPNHIGAPPNCRPECVSNSDCPNQMACINQRCSDPCPGVCGLNATCNTINHSPICSCTGGLTGDAFVQCLPIPQEQAVEETKDIIHCGNSTGCPKHLACINLSCRDPCPGACGISAGCKTLNHIPTCTCAAGYTGDPFIKCTAVPQDTSAPVARSQSYNPCSPSPCGPNALCRTLSNNPTCTCLPSYTGAPPNCRTECIVSTDCPTQMACINQRCSDPCPGTCGLKAICQTVNHNPVCTCSEGHTGDAFTQCTPLTHDAPAPVARSQSYNPCSPSPCGPNALCRTLSDNPTCTCLPSYTGAPPNCRPECIVSTDCPTQMACINQRCSDPCPGTCGLKAICQTVNHNPICTCSEGHTGDAFTQCTPLTHDAPAPDPLIIIDPVPYDPCYPSPCGANAACKISDGSPSCKCLPNYFGNAYVDCKPECIVSMECPNQMACINQRCRDPCPGVCGMNASCQTVNHSPVCTCSPGYTGNAFIQCTLFTHEAPTPVARTIVNSEPYDPCTPSPCGVNAQCKITGDKFATCECLPNHVGNPYEECKPECVINTDCPKQMTCLNQRCRDPCPGVCGTNATCSAINHIPTCTCSDGQTGDPFRECILILQETPIPVDSSQLYDPCTPSPCGPNSKCTNINNNPSCSCLPNHIGAPPNCRPECVSNSECPTQKACINLRCSDPCPGACGPNATCNTVNYRPVCSCSEDHTGDPFVNCIPISQDMPVSAVSEPSECEENGVCPVNRACINDRCRDPCPGVCGINATCATFNHSPHCSCKMGLEGDPYVLCKPISPRMPPPFVATDPCIPFPCGPNARCNGGVCSNITEYVGVPYESCKRQCVLNSDCPSHKACLRSKCSDPCPGTCGEKATCNVVNHLPICLCPDGFSGDPYGSCHEIVKKNAHSTNDPCTPSPCGPNSQCSIVSNNPTCSCQKGFVGSPPNCRQECTVNTECPETMACVNQTCANPCLGACGENAKCNVFRHRVICSCPVGYYGNALMSCHKIVKRAAYSVVDPCQPSPCGPNSKCGYVNASPACSCLKGFVGSPPSCRHECTLNTECPQTKACVDQKCVDPCQGACGEGAHCEVINHGAICSCRQGQSGDPCHSCQNIPVARASLSTQRHEPCTLSPCGANALCKNVDDKPSCTCLPNFIGAPPSCRPECVSNSECPRNRACVDEKCSDPCLGLCDLHSTCHTINHTPVCACAHGSVGYPIYECIPAHASTLAPAA